MTAARAEALLRLALGEDAAFRSGQLDAITRLVDRRQRLLVVQATGWGKSLVYFIATKLLRESGAGPTLLISPLLALMRDQMRMAERLGVRACSMTSANTDDWPTIEQALQEDRCDILLVSPERLGNERFQTQVLPSLRRGIGLFVVDEAHCISDWGHDFRPDYRRIVRVVGQLPGTVPVLATTATANDRVIADVREQLDGIEVSRGPLARKSLRLQSIQLLDQAERLAWLAQHVPSLPGSGIIYCLTVADAVRVASWLTANGVDAAPYYADLATETKEDLEQRLLRDDIKALVATVALGMGFDKPDLGFVVHFQRPGSIVAYYQQIGRAGRALDDAVAVLLNGREDDEIHDYFIANAFPGLEGLEAVIRAIELEPALTLSRLEATLNMKRGRLQQCLKLLEVDQAIYRDAGRYYRTPNQWIPDTHRWASVIEKREHELEQMKDFASTSSCLMESVLTELDDPSAAPCGRCANCVGSIVPVETDEQLVHRAIVFLRRAYRTIEPRKRWPAGVEEGSSVIPASQQADEGRALSIWGDAGWGAAVRAGKYRLDHFDDELIVAVADMVAEWSPLPRPAWVTAVPSLRHPELVDSFAERLAARLGLPYRRALVKVRHAEPQKTRENSAQQAANVYGAFGVDEAATLSGPVLLVDDIVDSKWTFTECARVLRLAGVEAVFPVALAEAGPAWKDTP